MPLSAAEVLELIARLVGVAVLVDTLELIATRPSYGSRGIWRWATIERDFAMFPRPLRTVLGRLLDDRGFPWVRAARGIAALASIALGLSLAAPVLLVTSLLVSARWRGTVNGGSDAMLMVLLLGLSLPAVLPGSALAHEAGLAYIAVQVALSYVIGGLTKLKEPQWRSGAALPALLAMPRYRAPAWLVGALADPLRARVTTAGVLAFECGFPLAFLGVWPCVVMLGAGLVFHAVNARVLGLNRFLLTWAAAYPAVLYLSQRGPLG